MGIILSHEKKKTMKRGKARRENRYYHGDRF